MTAPAVSEPGTVMAQARAENFPVASRFLPRSVRDDLLAVYGFARLVDDIGDDAPGDRDRQLDWVERELELVYRGIPIHPLMRRLAPAVRRHAIPEEPFRRLIQANRQDQVVGRYRSFGDLLGYCRLSADPVGHLVLHVLDAATPPRFELSDRICTGLQLTEHWQDVAEDLDRGRVYLPAEDMERFGLAEEELRSRRVTPAFRRLMAFEVDRARRFLLQGAPLAASLGGRAGLAVSAFVAGGLSALDDLQRAGFDVLAGPPRPSAPGRVWRFIRTAAAEWRP